ncbi:MAG TPA: hypothetical protein VLE99_00610 [Candidatus Saccharimonadales bacterium]|nr:hypothetical protein [Candidatus Saccharimonadales bacterium]
MSGKHGVIKRHRFHGDPARFEAVTALVGDRFGRRIRYIADVAGGQGMLGRFLNKAGYEAEVIDPRGWTLPGVASRTEPYQVKMADYYDLVVGLHPDQALRPVVESAQVRPILVVPCCNFWDTGQKLGRDALLAELEAYFCTQKIPFERLELAFEGPNNIGFLAGHR